MHFNARWQLPSLSECKSAAATQNRPGTSSIHPHGDSVFPPRPPPPTIMTLACISVCVHVLCPRPLFFSPNNTDNDAYTARCTRCVHTMKWYYVHTWPGLFFFSSVLRCCFSHIDRVYTTISMLHLLYDTRITSGFVDLSQTKCARSKWILSYGCPILTFC